MFGIDIDNHSAQYFDVRGSMLVKFVNTLVVITIRNSLLVFCCSIFNTNEEL